MISNHITHKSGYGLQHIAMAPNNSRNPIEVAHEYTHQKSPLSSAFGIT